MKTHTLARLMLMVGAGGLVLLAASMPYWFSMGQGLRTGHSDLLAFLALLFTGSFVLGLSQAWLTVFSTWTGKILPAKFSGGSRQGIFLGALGSLANLAVVLSVVLAGAASGQSVMTTPILLASLVLICLVLVFQWKWVSGFSNRSAGAENASL